MRNTIALILMMACIFSCAACNANLSDANTQPSEFDIVAKDMESNTELRETAEFFVDFSVKRRSTEEKTQLWIDNGLLPIMIEMGASYLASYSVEEKARKKTRNEWHDATDYERWTVESFDGLSLIADVALQKSYSKQWVIGVHGYTSDKSETVRLSYEYFQKGYNTLTPDLRSHGESEGEWITMGYYESRDILLWIEKIIDLDPDAEIILHGFSMGASTLMIASGYDLPYQVKAIVEDCGYASAWIQFEYMLDRFFGKEAYPYLYACDLVARDAAGFSFYDTSAINQVAKSQKPILFIHGEADTFVNVNNVYLLYEAATCQKDLLTIAKAGHGQAMLADYDLYWDKVWNFLGDNIGTSS